MWHKKGSYFKISKFRTKINRKRRTIEERFEILLKTA